MKICVCGKASLATHTLISKTLSSMTRGIIRRVVRYHFVKVIRDGFKISVAVIQEHCLGYTPHRPQGLSPSPCCYSGMGGSLPLEDTNFESSNFHKTEEAANETFWCNQKEVQLTKLNFQPYP